MPRPENLTTPKKGEVRNPNGRPKGSRNKSTIMKELLNSEIKVDGIKMTVEQQLIKKLHDLAKNGDLKAIDLVLNGAFGKDKQVVEQTVIEQRPPKIHIVKKDE